ncbi:MAG: hypothetical protein H3C36_07340 [Chitinophagaceae bacterium]|nr:hypothetical protein [Chitinophagaceae bacterium]MCW5913533.1 hypothetical protein [Chitinophagaceae bacterium]MCZ2395713.1 hypothetical protein [Chitinophagales bacterium]
MKSLYIFTLFSFLLVLSGCKKDDFPGTQEAVVVVDCTGTYLRVQNKDYNVCNIKIMAGFQDGDHVKATFTKIKECKEVQGPICDMLHPYESWIEVKAIKK